MEVELIGRSSRRSAGATPGAAFGRFVVLLAVALVYASGAGAPVSAAPATPELVRIGVVATLLPTGRMEVTERRGFSVAERVDGVEWRHPVPPGARVKILSVRGPMSPLRPAAYGDAGAGTYTVEQLPGVVIVYLDVHPDQSPWAYVVSYRVDGAAGRWTDTGDVIWDFVAPLEHGCAGPVTLRLSVPADVRAEAVRVFGADHPALVRASPGSVSVALRNLAAGRRLEVGVLMPAAALAEAPWHRGARLPIVALQQRAWEAEWSRLRLQRMLRVVALVAATVAVIALFALLYVYRGLGYRHRFRDQRATAIPADLPPAVVSYLWNGGRLDDHAVVATVLDLCDRGLVQYSQPDRGAGTLTLEPEATGMMPRHDAVFIQSLFVRADVGRALPLEQFRREASQRASWARDGLVDWSAAVEDAAARDGLLVRSDWIAQVVATLAALVLMVVSVYGALAIDTWVLLPFQVAVAAAAVLLSMKVFQHPSRDAVELYRRYKGLRNALADIGTMRERPVASVVLWRDYLVLAAVFGLAPQVCEQMRLDVPEAFAEPSFAGGYW